MYRKEKFITIMRGKHKSFPNCKLELRQNFGIYLYICNYERNNSNSKTEECATMATVGNKDKNR